MKFTTDQLLDRFLRYVQMDTQADERSTTYPSSPGQVELGKLLLQELRDMGIRDAHQNEHGIVFGTIPGNVPNAPVIAFNSHVDTSPETSGKNVKPQIHRNYQGGDIKLPGDPNKVIRVSENPALNDLHGKTIITTDGTTLLGADDKAGLAVIMEFARILMANPSIPRGDVRVVFTCDEEIGKGVLHLEPKEIGAVVAYTLDGAGTAEIEAETFSADKATINVTGVNIHPSIGKGRMINAVRLASMFIDRLPKRALSPETTDERAGFIHPYTIEGGVGQTTICALLRDFETENLASQAELLRSIAAGIEQEYPEAKLSVTITPQYRNMRDGIAKEPRAMAYADTAVRRAGLIPKHQIIRGGTDGAQLTAKGLPTPNLSTGEHNPHSPLEWTCLEEMDAAVRVLVELAQVWAGK